MSGVTLLALACDPNTEITTDIACIPNEPFAFVSKTYGIGLGLIGGVAILFIIYGGYLILTSQGEPIQLEKGKSYLYYSMAGVLLAVLGFVFIKVIAVNILRIPGFE